MITRDRKPPFFVSVTVISWIPILYSITTKVISTSIHPCYYTIVILYRLYNFVIPLCEAVYAVKVSIDWVWEVLETVPLSCEIQNDGVL